MPPDSTAGTRACSKNTRIYTGTRTTVASTHVTQHATANMPCLQAHEALPDRRIPLRAQQVFTPPHTYTKTHTHTHTCAHTHTRTHTHTHSLLFRARARQCAAQPAATPATDESYIIRRTIAGCVVCVPSVRSSTATLVARRT